MKERNWKELGKELSEMVGHSTKETALVVQVKEDSIELLPAETNIGRTFYHMHEVVDFCRCKGLSSYVTVDGKNAICHIY